MRYDFVILTHGRSGSHLLASLLNSHPDIACEGEFAKEDKLISESEIAGKYRGCILPYSQAKLLRILRPAKVIHLVRDPHRNAVSALKNIIRYRIRKAGGKPPHDPEVTRKAVNAKATQIKKAQTKFHWMLAEQGFDTLDISYQQMSRDQDVRTLPKVITLRLCRFLGAKPQKLVTTLEKRK